MTRDEILAMPAGKGLDAYVHKYVFNKLNSVYNASFIDIPPYSTSIVEALEVWKEVMHIIKDVYITAHTDPADICRAALLAVMDKP